MRRVGLLGAGAIGMAVVQAFETRQAPGHVLASVLARPWQLEPIRARLGPDVVLTSDPQEFLATRTDIIVEAIGHTATLEIGPDLLSQGRDFYLMSVGVLADAGARERFEAAARQGAARIVVPSGALAGFDGLRALAQLNDCVVTYTSTKPPFAWAGTPGEAAIRARPADAEVTIFEGLADEAALQFPKNANLAAAVALAGVGFERTRVRLVSNRDLTDNVGEIDARTPTSVMRLSLSGSSFEDNPKSSQITVASILAALVNHDALVSWG